MSRVEKVYVNSTHELITKSDLYFMIGSYYESKDAEVDIFITNPNNSTFAEKNREKLEQYFKKKVNILTVKDDAKEEIAETKDSTSKGTLYGIEYLLGDYINTPFFIGNSNMVAYSVCTEVLEQKGRSNLVFIYGPTSTGKTHLLQHMVYKALKSGINVYYNGATKFLDELKAYNYSEKEFDKLVKFVKKDNKKIFFLDDFQLIDQDKIQKHLGVIFEFLNLIKSEGINAIIASDKQPKEFAVLPERTVMRLIDGYTCSIETPEYVVKKQYIDYFAKENKISIPDYVANKICIVSGNFRELRNWLFGFTASANSNAQMDNFVSLLTASGKKTSSKSEELHSLRQLLLEYYGLTDYRQQADQKKKSHKIGKIDNILYYLFQSIIDTNTLRSILKIDRRNHSYSLRSGEAAYNKIDDDVLKDNIRRVTEFYDSKRS